MKTSLKAFLASACLLLVLASCTVTPKIVKDAGASFDGNARNSGLIGYDPAGRGILTPHARDRYHALIEMYGKRFDPPLRAGDGLLPTATNTVLIDAEHLVDFATMNGWRKAEGRK